MKIFFYILFIIFFFVNFSYSKESAYFLSLKNNKVNVRYGPGLDYPVKYIYKKIHLPVKVIDKRENFRKIIDFKKNSGWIHISQLKDSKSFITLKEKILFKKPSFFSKPILKLETGRLLIVKKCKNNWCKIETGKHSGWINDEDIWGKVE
tara:strand:- start:348 stop:797 length:450 start_codon:yes stop_codon:yes gene_type:complete